MQRALQVAYRVSCCVLARCVRGSVHFNGFYRAICPPSHSDSFPFDEKAAFYQAVSCALAPILSPVLTNHTGVPSSEFGVAGAKGPQRTNLRVHQSRDQSALSILRSLVADACRRQDIHPTPVAAGSRNRAAVAYGVRARMARCSTGAPVRR